MNFKYKTPKRKSYRKTPKRSKKRSIKTNLKKKSSKRRSTRMYKKKGIKDGMKRSNSYSDDKSGKKFKTDRTNYDLSGQYKSYKDLEYISEDSYLNSNRYSKIRREILNINLELCYLYEYNLETYFLSVAIFDKFMLKYTKQINTIRGDLLELISITSLIIAAKFTEVYTETIKTYSISLSSDFGVDNIVQTEKDILEYLDWNVNLPTSYYFLKYYIHKGIVLVSDNLIKLSEYILILLTMDINSLKYKPSLLALCSLLVAEEQTNKETHPLWIQPLIDFTGYNSIEITNCKTFILTSVKSIKMHDLSSFFLEDYDSIKEFTDF